MPARGKRAAPARPIRLRHTKTALLIFGLGLVIGLVVVVGEFTQWEYLASAVMALGLVLLPLGLFADGRGIAALRWLARRFAWGKHPRTGRGVAGRRKTRSRAVARPPRRARG
jgi:hypothetical protein